MSVEGVGRKFFCYTATVALKALRVIPVYDDIYELHLMELLAAEPHLWTSVRLHREHIFNDVRIAAEYELKMFEALKKPNELTNTWVWNMMSGLGNVLYNKVRWKRENVLVVKIIIIRTGQNEWRPYKVRPA